MRFSTTVVACANIGVRQLRRRPAISPPGDPVPAEGVDPVEEVESRCYRDHRAGGVYRQFVSKRTIRIERWEWPFAVCVTIPVGEETRVHHRHLGSIYRLINGAVGGWETSSPAISHQPDA
jgi:hypothetical protein